MPPTKQLVFISQKKKKDMCPSKPWHMCYKRHQIYCKISSHLLWVQITVCHVQENCTAMELKPDAVFGRIKSNYGLVCHHRLWCVYEKSPLSRRPFDAAVYLFHVYYQTWRILVDLRYRCLRTSHGRHLITLMTSSPVNSFAMSSEFMQTCGSSKASINGWGLFTTTGPIAVTIP